MRSARSTLSAGAFRAGLAEAVPVARAYSQRRVKSALAPRARAPALSRGGIAFHYHHRSCAQRRTARRGMMLRAGQPARGRSLNLLDLHWRAVRPDRLAGPPHFRDLAAGKLARACPHDPRRPCPSPARAIVLWRVCGCDSTARAVRAMQTWNCERICRATRSLRTQSFRPPACDLPLPVNRARLQAVPGTTAATGGPQRFGPPGRVARRALCDGDRVKTTRKQRLLVVV